MFTVIPDIMVAGGEVPEQVVVLLTADSSTDVGTFVSLPRT